MKKIMLSLTALILMTFSIGNVRAASIGVCSNGNLSGSTLCSDSTASGKNPIYQSLKIILEIISTIAGIVAVFSIISIGIRFITGGGNSDTYSKAKSSLVYVIVGVLVVALSQTIILIVLNKLT